MRKFLRRQLTYFLIGFVVAFIIYLFVRYDADDIVLGVVISAFAGITTCAALIYLDRKFPDQPDPKPEPKPNSQA